MMGILYTERLAQTNPNYLKKVSSSDLFMVSMVCFLFMFTNFILKTFVTAIPTKYKCPRTGCSKQNFCKAVLPKLKKIKLLFVQKIYAETHVQLHKVASLNLCVNPGLTCFEQPAPGVVNLSGIKESYNVVRCGQFYSF